MSQNLQVRDANGAIQYLGEIGLGTNANPNIPTVAPPQQWSAYHAPAVNTQATISKAAGAATVQHVCTGVSFTLSQDTTGGSPYTGTVNLRDGATGAGTILASWYIGCITTASAHASFSISGLNIPGTVATAMSLEFTAAPGAHAQESVQMFGYDITN